MTSKLPLELCPELFRNAAAVALPGPLEGDLPEPFPGGLPVRKLLGRVAVAEFVQGEFAAGGHLQGAGDRVRVVLEKGRERGRGLQVVLRVGLDQASRAGERDSVADAGEDVLEPAPRGVVVEHLGGGRRGDAVAARPLPQPPLPRRLVRPAVAGHQRVEPVAEGVPEVPGDERGFRLPHQQALLAAPQRHEPAGVGADLAPFDDALSLGRAEASGGDEPAEMGVAGAVGGQQQDGGAVGDGHPGADDQVQAQFPGLHVGAHGAVDAVPVGQAERLDPQLRRPLQQLLGMARPLQERVVALAVEGRVGHGCPRLRGHGPYSTFPCRNQPCRLES